MLLRILCAIFGVAFCCLLSQLPEFSQQYLQRLAGAVDELNLAVIQVTEQAKGLGMSRAQLLQNLSMSEAGNAMVTMFNLQSERLSMMESGLASIREGGVAARILAPVSYFDAKLVDAVWSDFRPAVPLTLEGLGLGAIGYGLGVLIATMFYNVFGFLRPKRQVGRKAADHSVEPPVTAKGK